VTKPSLLRLLGLLLSEKQIPQVVENLESGDQSKEGLETAALRPRQVGYWPVLVKHAVGHMLGVQKVMGQIPVHCFPS
jgi:hypothetical protein